MVSWNMNGYIRVNVQLYVLYDDEKGIFDWLK